MTLDATETLGAKSASGSQETEPAALGLLFDFLMVGLERARPLSVQPPVEFPLYVAAALVKALRSENAPRQQHRLAHQLVSRWKWVEVGGKEVRTTVRNAREVMVAMNRNDDLRVGLMGRSFRDLVAASLGGAEDARLDLLARVRRVRASLIARVR
jgi:hypothetical protein